MFTGIVEEVGQVLASREEGGNRVVTIGASKILEDMRVGDSVACSGACLTVTAFDREGFSVALSRESVARTAPRWEVGSRLNLERAMRADGRFGGHLVSGHVDGTGTVVAVSPQPGAWVVEIEAPPALRPYLVAKGSVSVDGVSLTVVEVRGRVFSTWLIPHTLEVTTLAELTPGAVVNLEADLLAKYVERILQTREALR
ncbi:riboflavin synthase [Calidithermus roseus]|uniref:Riboflavin synthase n=1 Tax=Calidithermus roseus TaxID=1644118 RepID=A0A399ERI9_9DEIN|nr:riboflavin synthase [Calidithermus roseus]RIH86140.1 Riboflavin synthase [Calidithermus roseus]